MSNSQAMTHGDPATSASSFTPLVVCVVLNFNGAADTIACVQSLLAQDYPSLQILVVDNASTDSSISIIRAALPSVELLQFTSNSGFASGNNLAIRVALERSAAYIWLLNNDTVAPPNTLSLLVSAAQSKEAAITGTVLNYFHDPSSIQAWGGGSLSRLTGFSSHYKRPTPLGENSFLTFASVLVRRDVFQQIGLLDENFFMYFEDADFCFRARAAGFKLAIAPQTAVLHKEGGSNLKQQNCRMARIVTASGVRFLSLHGRPRFLAPVIFVSMRVARRLGRGDLHGVVAVLRGARDARRRLANPLAYQGPWPL